MSPYRSEVVSPASLDGPTAERLTAVCNATQALAAPAAVPSQADSLRLELLHGWDDRPVDIVALTWDHDELVGWGSARFTRWDNPTAAQLAMDVHPDHQRRGIGSQLLELLTSVCAERGRVYRLLARRREDGAWAGHTVVCVDRHRPGVAFQEDTTVVSGHRGHRLGIRLKTAMLKWLRDAEPGLTTIDTWNAVSNRHMIAVNDAIGCQVVNHGIVWQTYTERR